VSAQPGADTLAIREMTVTRKPITKESAKETVKTIVCGNAGLLR
jgi:hypothetical protein